jgi:hypothetical protein
MALTQRTRSTGPGPLIGGARRRGGKLSWASVRSGTPVASARGLAERHGVSHRTALRWLKEGRCYGAFRATERWWVPTYDLSPPRVKRTTS